MLDEQDPEQPRGRDEPAEGAVGVDDGGSASMRSWARAPAGDPAGDLDLLGVLGGAGGDVGDGVVRRCDEGVAKLTGRRVATADRDTGGEVPLDRARQQVRGRRLTRRLSPGDAWPVHAVSVAAAATTHLMRCGVGPVQTTRAVPTFPDLRDLSPLPSGTES